MSEDCDDHNESSDEEAAPVDSSEYEQEPNDDTEAYACERDDADQDQ